MNGSPLRFNSVDDDDEVLISRVPVVPSAPLNDSADGSVSYGRSPLLLPAKKKQVLIDTPTDKGLCEPDSTVGAHDASDNASDGGSDVENSCGIVLER